MLGNQRATNFTRFQRFGSARPINCCRWPTYLPRPRECASEVGRWQLHAPRAHVRVQARPSAWRDRHRDRATPHGAARLHAGARPISRRAPICTAWLATLALSCSVLSKPSTPTHRNAGIGSSRDISSADGASTVLLAALAQSITAKLQASATLPPTIVFHGDADATVHVSNGAAIIEASTEASGSVPAARAAEGQSSKGQRYTRTVFTDGAGRSTAEYWQLHGAGHAWSGGSARGSYTNPAGADASAEMLRFFLAHPLRA